MVQNLFRTNQRLLFLEPSIVWRKRMVWGQWLVHALWCPKNLSWNPGSFSYSQTRQPGARISVFNSQPQRKDYMMQFLTEITGQSVASAHSIWETSAVPGSSMCLIFNTTLTLLAGLFIFPHSFPWNHTFERYPTGNTFSEKLSSERELASSSVLYHSRFWRLSQWPILEDVFKYIGLTQKKSWTFRSTQ